MDQKLVSIVGDLRKMSSDEAANWLVSHYPVGSSDWGEAITIIPHLSWKKADQLRLADHYLSKLPFASARPYEAFASFMKVSRLVEILKKSAPISASDRDLLEYYAGPALTRAAKTPEDRDAVESFRSELKAR